MQNTKKIQKIMVRCSRVSAILVLSLLLLPPGGVVQAEPVNSALSTLTVSGNGEVAVSPDRAYVRLGAVVQTVEAADAQKRINQVMQGVLQGITKLGISEKNIQTTGLSLSPVYTRPERKQGGDAEAPRIAGYRASNTVKVQVDDLSLVGAVIDAGIGAGANQLQGISFDTSQADKYRREALQLAAKEARAKADAIAAALQLRLGDILEIQEEGVHIARPHAERMYAAAAADATPVQPGQLQIRAGVQIRFSINGQN